MIMTAIDKDSVLFKKTTVPETGTYILTHFDILTKPKLLT